MPTQKALIEILVGIFSYTGNNGIEWDLKMNEFGRFAECEIVIFLGLLGEN